MTCEVVILYFRQKF
ncbi:unnamed protein product [Ranitomeya imitator]|uniref:Uncharacterized protein n=1 Tax=Ranitomeya imitator TaxID=111125 RepID=A0ABN9L2Z5_9NEOB|nr:unnamed protein product [Ranitomeya imitator]